MFRGKQQRGPTRSWVNIMQQGDKYGVRKCLCRLVHKIIIKRCNDIDFLTREVINTMNTYTQTMDPKNDTTREG